MREGQSSDVLPPTACMAVALVPAEQVPRVDLAFHVREFLAYGVDEEV